jgi:hypothetical protein
LSDLLILCTNCLKFFNRIMVVKPSISINKPQLAKTPKLIKLAK